MAEEQANPGEVYYDLKKTFKRVEVAIPTREKPLVLEKPYATSDPFEITALDASPGAKRITKRELDAGKSDDDNAVDLADLTIPLLDAAAAARAAAGQPVDGFKASGTKAEKAAALSAAGVTPDEAAAAAGAGTEGGS